MKKRILAFLTAAIAAVAIFSFAACGDYEDDNGPAVITTGLKYELDSSATSYTLMGKGSVKKVNRYRDIAIPQKYNGLPVTVICSSAFSGWLNLKRVSIPDSIITVGNYAFYSCVKLESVTIGNGVKTIGEGAFGNCEKLSTVNFNGTKEQWGAIDKRSEWDLNTGDYVVHCTDGDIAK